MLFGFVKRNGEIVKWFPEKEILHLWEGEFHYNSDSLDSYIVDQQGCYYEIIAKNDGKLHLKILK